MLGAIKSETVQDLSIVHIPTPEEIAMLEEQRREQARLMQLQFEHQEINGLTGEISENSTPNAVHKAWQPISLAWQPVYYPPPILIILTYKKILTKI